MSKIQKALKKIQAGAAGGAQSQDDAESATQQIAAIKNRSVDKDSSAYDPDATITLPEKIIEFNDDALREAGLLAPATDEAALAADYRNIKRPLLAHAFGKRATQVPDGHLIMVSSALPGEGKTFTCINLSLSMAREKDSSVLLVDADLAKPHITSLFGAQNEFGLLDILDGTVLDLSSVILDTSISGLKILPAGQPRENATELLSSERMEQVVSELRRVRQRVVLFDSPPLLLTSEAKVLASLVGQICMVVQAGSTPRQAVIDGLSTLPEGKATNLILNQARVSGISPYYGGGSNYGYGYGYQYGKSKDS